MEAVGILANPLGEVRTDRVGMAPPGVLQDLYRALCVADELDTVG